MFFFFGWVFVFGFLVFCRSSLGAPRASASAPQQSVSCLRSPAKHTANKLNIICVSPHSFLLFCRSSSGAPRACASCTTSLTSSTGPKPSPPPSCPRFRRSTRRLRWPTSTCSRPTANVQHLDLIHAPYVSYAFKSIDPVSLTPLCPAIRPFQPQRRPGHARRRPGHAIIIGNVVAAPLGAPVNHT